MKTHTLLIACVLLAAGTAAQADCASDLAALSTGAEEGELAKDGTHVPLGNASSAAPAASAEAGSEMAEGDAAGDQAAAEANKLAKDGSTAPLEAAGEGTPVATSGQDIAAQQAGEPTAAEQAEADGEGGTEEMPSTRAGAIEKARTALAAGDEEACMTALEHARSL